MKTPANNTAILAIAAALTMTAAALANPNDNHATVKLLTLGPTQVVPTPGKAEIPIPTEFARFGALPHPGAAFAPFNVVRTIRLGKPVAFPMGNQH